MSRRTRPNPDSDLPILVWSSSGVPQVLDPATSQPLDVAWRGLCLDSGGRFCFVGLDARGQRAARQLTTQVRTVAEIEAAFLRGFEEHLAAALNLNEKEIPHMSQENTSPHPSGMDFERWMEEMYYALECKGVTRSDAQGIADVQQSTLETQWEQGATPQAAADAVWDAGFTPMEPESPPVLPDFTLGKDRPRS